MATLFKALSNVVTYEMESRALGKAMVSDIEILGVVNPHPSYYKSSAWPRHEVVV